jgi:hypothetical protein
MWQPSKPTIDGTGLFVVGHCALAGYGDIRALDNLLQPPPLAAVVMPASSGSISSAILTYGSVNAITDNRVSIGSAVGPGTVAKST